MNSYDDVDEPWTESPYPECPECDGTGEVIVDHPGIFDLEATCPKCGGMGVILPEPDDDEGPS